MDASHETSSARLRSTAFSGFPMRPSGNGPPPAADRTPMVNAYQASLPVHPGDPQAGRLLFRKHCVGCHRVEEVGHQLGPSLAAMQARGPDAMLIGILDPNREVLPAFTSRTAVLADGRVVSGVLVAESEAAVTLRAAEGIEHSLDRREIDELTDTGRSLMPEGFERSIDPREMADLLAYLMSAR
jgi:putative heme-binding domain-containing protein